EVRKVLSTFNLDVNRLIRMSYGPFQLLDMVPGQVEPVRRKVLVDQLGPRLARDFGLMDVSDDERETRANRKANHPRNGPERGDRPAKDDASSARTGRTARPRRRP